jgi:hypothetical protein
MPDDYERGITASSLYNYPRLSENVSHAPPLTGANFLLAQLDPRSQLWRNAGPFDRTSPLHPMDWVDRRWPAPNYAEPEPATSAFSIADQMRAAPFLEQISRLLDAPNTKTPTPLWRPTQTPGRY